ncbi:AraC family transcriptional regulator [Pandoraea thiooxydans]|uniref:AraC family transcriptional regulator n=1 Tax=Pandoraea thiooxydans TaxID=445709 RepID=A0A0G3EQE3_9BURK|nr:helix-turn-helix transcriptional regulator [Pandoraea thiooxydans]AKJ68259.1 AraC family transcriptional regulator [Pandoraea thiooxydans]APR95577.1 AraC family transcriptional regulator [Pandoraea thiooxydans]
MPEQIPSAPIALHIVPHEYGPSDARPVRLRSRPLAQGVVVPRHAHPWAQVAYTTQGVIRLAVANAAWIVPPSRALWIPPHTPHQLSILKDAYLRTLYVLPAAIPTALSGCRVVEVSPLLRELIAAIDQPGPLDPARERLLGALALDEIGRAAPLPLQVPLPSDKRLLSLCNAILADPARTWTLEQWSRYAGASSRTIARLFRQEMGTTFVHWRQQALLAQAIPLASRGYSLARIAHELGYSSQSAFSAMFRRAFGESPSTFFARGQHQVAEHRTPPARSGD